MDLANSRQRGMAIETYYGKLTHLWRSLFDYQRAKTMEEVRKEREEDKLHQFLMGMDETVYGSVKSVLLSRVPLSTLEEAYHMVQQDEESKNLDNLRDAQSKGVSFAFQSDVSQSRNINNNRGGSAVFKNCGRVGHIEENCYQLVGYPPWFNDRSKQRSGTNSRDSPLSGGAWPWYAKLFYRFTYK